MLTSHYETTLFSSSFPSEYAKYHYHTVRPQAIIIITLSQIEMGIIKEFIKIYLLHIETKKNSMFIEKIYKSDIKVGRKTVFLSRYIIP
jgi:hypothetical protein